jgi:hypothetical protein
MLVVMGWGVFQFVGLFIILDQCVFMFKSNMGLCVCKCIVHLLLLSAEVMYVKPFYSV